MASQFRDGLVAYRRIEADGVGLNDGNRAGAGDRIVARIDDWALTTRSGVSGLAIW